MAPLRTRAHYLCGPLVFAVFAFVSRRRGIIGRTGSVGRPHHYLALGAALRTRTEQKMSPRIETYQWLLEGRRDVYLPRRELAIPISCGGFHRRYDRLLVFR